MRITYQHDTSGVWRVVVTWRGRTAQAFGRDRAIVSRAAVTTCYQAAHA